MVFLYYSTGLININLLNNKEQLKNIIFKCLSDYIVCSYCDIDNCRYLSSIFEGIKINYNTADMLLKNPHKIEEKLQKIMLLI